MPPRRSRRRAASLVGLLVVVVLTLTGTGVVWTNAFGAGERFDNLMDRVRLAIDPPPDRDTLPTIEVTPPPLEAAMTRPPAGTLLEAGPTPTPRPPRRPVDVKIRTNPARMFISQQTNDWCAPSGVQMVLAMHGIVDNSPETQRKLADGIDAWESWRDSHNGGWGPAAMVEALADYGLEGYEIRSYRRRDHALRDSAAALSETKAPVILIAWRGAHTWVMTGFRADADPTIFNDATVTGAYIYDPWYPRISTIWGPSDRPGTFQDAKEMERNFLRWQRPEGAYRERDGKYIALVPTIPLRDQAAARS